MLSPNVVHRLALYCITLFLIGSGLSVVTSTLWLLTPLSEQHWFMVTFAWTIGAALLGGYGAFVMLFVVHRLVVPDRDFHFDCVRGKRVHVGLTAYNDEKAIADAVREFKACPEVHKVIVVENNSKDGTYKAAVEAGADTVITEIVPGYGSCCMRTLAEAAVGADIVILCEGDMTFSAHDVKKFLAYIENCDLVLGTRATQELRDRGTQMDWLMNPANQVVAKLVQTRFWGTRLTDVGCTYRAIRVEAYQRLKDKLTVLGNHFSPHMYMEALKLEMRVIEIPVTFRQRVGISKGVGSNKLKAARVALRMLESLYKA